MSYRNRLGLFPKDSHEKYKHLSYNDFLAKYDDNSTYRLACPDEYQELLVIQSLKSIADNIHFKPFYLFDCQQYEFEFYIIEQADLEYIIYAYHDIIFQYYNNLEKELTDNLDNKKLKDSVIIDKLLALLFNRKNEWKKNPNYTHYNLDKDKNLTDSGLDDYSFFNLLNIYRNFDYNNNYLIYSGW